MAGRIPKHFIDELIARADILEVVGTRVALKRAGSNYKGLCPFHGEKSPSFTVSPAKGFYHCFGCGAHGTAIGFLMAHDNLEFPEAVEALAEMLSLEVPREQTGQPERKDDNDELYALLREADQIYRAALRTSEKAIAYLKKRGIDGPTAGRFGIGYAPDAWDTVLRALGTSEERVQKLMQAGLVVNNDNGRRYDRFRDRIMFPIRNSPRGQIIGFGGRVLDSGEPKYLNSPETPVFRKGHELYGLYEARQTPGRPKQMIVVEGYLDVASLVQHGIEHVVATLGTATTTENLRRLTRLTERILFCFDGDRAGRAAAWRALETALPYGGGTLELKFLLLPEGDDPDSFVRTKGAAAFLALADKAEPLADFLVKELASRVDLTTVDGRARFPAIAKPVLKRLPEGMYRTAVMDALATSLHVRPEALDRMMTDETAPPPTAAQQHSHAAATHSGAGGGARRKTRAQHAIGLVLHFPRAANQLTDLQRLDELNQPGAELLRRILEIARGLSQPTTAQILENLRGDPDLKYVERLAAEEPLDSPEDAGRVLNDALNLMVQDAIKSRAGAAVRAHRPTPAD
jgi:DNA primase